MFSKVLKNSSGSQKVIRGGIRSSGLPRRELLKAAAVCTLGAATFNGSPYLEAVGLTKDSASPPSPPWTKDLIIYEVATRGFTSPNGPESGTFKSTRSMLPHLEELGVTAIWLAGYSHCDPHHFFNIWSQYAVIEPDKFDPALGTEQDFAALIDDAHRREIRVFLDVITHGLMNYSPIIKAHPNWFRGSSWHMTDFDWNGGHKDLDDWWVNIYTNFVRRYGVDGYRLDVGMFRPDLWEIIRKNAFAAGHPIAIFSETQTAKRGVTDFTQRQNIIPPDHCPHCPNRTCNHYLLKDLPGFYERTYGGPCYYHASITYADGKKDWGSTKGGGRIIVRVAGLTTDKVGHHFHDAPDPKGLPYVQLVLENVLEKAIRRIAIHNDMDQSWQLDGQPWAGGWIVRPLIVKTPPASRAEKHRLHVYIPTVAWGVQSVQVSCHDNSVNGLPLDKSPYVVQGSRCIIGYSGLLTPMIPIFFSGEEFNATFHPLPTLSPFMYGGKDPGKGSWLYGCQLDWSEIKETSHKDMFVDVKKIIAIRKAHSNILGAWPADKIPNLRAVWHRGNIPVPRPYVRWNDRAAIVVLGNRNTTTDANLTINLPLGDIGLGGRAAYKVTDLWSGGPDKIHSEQDFKAFSFTVKRDKIAGGGLAVYMVEAA